MKKTSETIVFFGNERLATGVTTDAPTLQALIKAGYNIAAVVANYSLNQPKNVRKLEVRSIAEQCNIPVLLPEKLSSVIDQLRSYKAAVGILVAYGKIVPQVIIDIFPKGIINIHPSLLPLHRGPTPIESAVLNGEAKTGVSLMRLAKEMDAGPVYGQAEIVLKGDETKQQLADHLLEIGGAMLLKLLPDILAGTVVALPQDSSRATYDRLITKQDGFIDWNLPASMLERQIRAHAVWPSSKAEIGEKEVTVIEAGVVEASGVAGEVITANQKLIVCCGKKAIEIVRLKPAGKREMSAQEFLRGNRL